MYRKWLSIGLLIILVGSMVMANGCVCGSGEIDETDIDDVVGTWINRDDTEEYYIVKDDGTFMVQYRDGDTLKTT